MRTSVLHRRTGRRSPVWAVLLAALALLFTACTASYAPTELPPTAPSEEPAVPPAGGSTCPDALRSYAPSGDLPTPGEMPSGSTMAEIADRGRLIVGVSSDTRLLGARNRETGQIEGFDTDLARDIAEAIFDDPDAIELRVITASQRIPLLADGEVDLVVRNFTINCDRWEEIAFSAEYYRAGTKILAGQYANISGLADLADRRVCMPSGTTQAALLAEQAPSAIPVYAANHTQCLRLFQTDQADAIIGDDAVLAGLASQDPNAEVMDTDPITPEPYGVGVNAENDDLVRFVNAVLAERAEDGRWQDSYDRWLAEYLGPASPPEPEYGRSE
ncbi:glutamate ABC transporter substrate-binding protein [Naumannella halotolerans]|uniref:Polar amino acid transport system substrate-binding protein n=1 Tax=Naumannella halotolerans TaxID=993414 RepID=A0A4R7J9X4_9ACTN|nr:glutamate ABC transporter substrate-binding protein [Naumannella halotolerans]TDT33716.1 polar amino acid transport system substrate-binding protein [Naumannella halotolerans]